MAVTFGAPRGGLEKSGIGLIPRVSAAADGYGIMQGPAKHPEWEPHGGERKQTITPEFGAEIVELCC